MATYKLIGQRYLRKYTATRATPVYAASTDAQKIVSELCSVPWEKVSERNATMTYHTSETVAKDADGNEVSGLDMNVKIRDEFDAALFCAEHEGGMHRAYANAAVYVYAVPSAAQGRTLTSLSATVTSDPYNSNGCRLHVWTGDALSIPTSCNDVRGCDSSGADLTDGTVAAGVAPRTVKPVTTTDSKGKSTTTDYWYPTTATATLSPTGWLPLKKYLFLAVVMESYSTTRGNWIEGCSYITNNVSVTLSSDVSGWTDGETYDLRAGGVEGEVALDAGVNPTWLQPLATKAAETKTALGVGFVVRHDSSATSKEASFDLTACGYDEALEPVLLRTASNYVCSAMLTSTTLKGLVGITKEKWDAYLCDGTLPSVSYSWGWIEGKIVADYTQLIEEDLTAGGVTIPAMTATRRMAKVKGTFNGGTSSHDVDRYFYYICTENDKGEIILVTLTEGLKARDEANTDYRFAFDVAETRNLGRVPTSDASSRVRDGTAADELLGDLSWQVVTGDRSMSARTAADTFEHLVGLLGEASGRVAQDYAAAGGTFPVSDLDCVTVVPRFERQATATASYASLPQPGISLWYRKSSGAFAKKGYVGIKDYGSKVQCVDSPSFIQGSFLVVRAPKSGSRLVLTAGAAVANNGLSLKIAAWRSGGVAWDRASGFHTAAQLPKVTGFANASVESLSVPEVKIGESGEYAGAAVCGGVKAELLGTTATITGALAKGDSFEIALTKDVKEGDAIILSPVPVAFTGTATTGAYFGRQSAPTATTAAKGWARSTADLGWFPKVEVY